MTRAALATVGLLALCCPAACDDRLEPLLTRTKADSAADGGVDGAGDAAPPWRAPGACAEHADCPAGTICSRQAPGCVAPVCGLVDPDGWVTGGDVCYAGRECELGFVCTPALLEFVLPIATGPSGKLLDICLPACDPCRSDCARGMQCIQRPDGGGFCHAGPLVDEGERCDQDRFCMAGMGCFWERCVRFCSPDDGIELGVGSLAGYPSADCPPNALCYAEVEANGLGVYPRLYVCNDAATAAVGEGCGLDGKRCRYPAQCSNGICRVP